MAAVMSQTPPSANISPSNVHASVNPPRQLRQPRQPLYTPAALRPTDHGTRPTDIPGRPRAPDTPPASKDSSFDGAHDRRPSEADLAAGLGGTSSDLKDFEALRRGLSRAASATLEEEFGEVTAPPTTAHWKPDASARACYICAAAFTWYHRRHHCRRCGNLVCDAHSRHHVPLDQHARYHPRGLASRACRHCWEDWKIVKKLHPHSRTSSLAGSSSAASASSSSSSHGTAVPIPQPAAAARKGLAAMEAARVGSMARSEGMVWSTF